MVGRPGGAPIIYFGVEHLVKLGIGAHLVFWQVRTALIPKRAQGNILQAVTGRADFGVNLQAALQLHLVIRAERPLEREVIVGHLRCLAGGKRRTSKTKCEGCGKCDLTDHSCASFHSAGVGAAAVVPSPFAG